MQYVYAYKQCQRSNHELAYQYVREAYAPDLNSMEVQDRDQLAADKKATIGLLDLHFAQKPMESSDQKQLKVAQEAITRYESQCSKDQIFLLNQMVDTTERVSDHYLLFLLMMIEMADESHREQNKKSNLGVRTDAPPVDTAQTNFYLNRVVQALRDKASLHHTAKANKLNWNKYRVEIRQWYRNLIKPDEQFQAYQAQQKPELQDDIQIARYIFNSLVLKSDPISNVFEEADINWTENNKAIRSMVNKTLKSVQEDGDTEIVDLTPNWEDDREFLTDLYKITIKNDKEYEQIIRNKTKNWTVERIASLDSIIIKMAIAEMTHFSSIPIKVTINEYIDLSKNYSTEKSKQFVNGMLDVIAQHLQQDNRIKKSGRGLIDNQ